MCIIEEIINSPDYIPSYWLSYDNNIKKIFQRKVLKQLMNNWTDTMKWLMVYRHFEIDTNPMMEMITKIFLFIYRNNKQILANKRQERRKLITKRNKLYTLRNKITL